MLNWIQNLIAPKSTFSATQAANNLKTMAQPSITVPTQLAQLNTPSVDGIIPQKMPLRSAKLIMVSPDNNNKFYDMSEKGDGTFDVIYGRVGAKGSLVNYPMTEWDSKVREKVRKGYKDQTHLFAINGEKMDSSLEGIDCEFVRQLIQDLMQYAKQSISHNYVVTADKVTRQQVTEAQRLLDKLVELAQKPVNKEDFNSTLIELFQIIPRRMVNVRDHLIQNNVEIDVDKLEKQLSEEQATLDVMRGQVEINEQQKNNTTNEDNRPIDILSAMGLGVEVVADKKTEQLIKTMMGTDKSKFHRAYKVTNYRTERQFQQFTTQSKNKATTLFWHGSRNENWLSILKTGLVLRPANAVITGKMFGYGLYFADKFQKSLNYSSLTGSYWSGGRSNKAYLALYEVHTGNQLHVQRHEPWCGLLTEERLKDRGEHFNSVFAKGGADLINNEFIVYNEAQCTVKYIVEVR